MNFLFVQIQESLAPKSADPSGSWNDCRLNYAKCTASQIQFLQGETYKLIMMFLILNNQTN